MAEARSSLRADQVQQTRAALLDAGRRLFGRDGFAATAVDDVAREARLTTGAMYHHFPNKTALFEAVFARVHEEMTVASLGAAAGGGGSLEMLARGCDAFLDAVLKPDVQRILIVDAPAVLGLARFTELDEQYALGPTVAALQGAGVGAAETVARLLMGALTRGAMLIATSPVPQETRDAVSAAVRSLLAGLATVQP